MSEGSKYKNNNIDYRFPNDVFCIEFGFLLYNVCCCLCIHCLMINVYDKPVIRRVFVFKIECVLYNMYQIYMYTHAIIHNMWH